MIVIANVSDTIEELLNLAEEHIEYAHEIREEYPNLAQNYYSMSISEITCIASLHEQVVKLIEDYRREHGDPPERMMGRYEYLHKKHIEKANKIKILQSLFK